MRPYVRRIAAVSAAAYLLAGWLTAALHSHGHAHHGPARAEKVEAVCTTCSCGHHHGAPKPAHEESPDRPDEGCHHCPICEFLAKPPVVASAVTLDAAPEPGVETAEPLLPAFEPVSLFVSRSRGPPVA